MTHPSSGKSMELDVYIEDIKLAIEYHGVQHYAPVYIMNTNFETQQIRDKEKREACKLKGITLIEVPHWWDRTKESLGATIHQERPALIPNPPDALPIPNENPDGGQTISPLSHGQVWDGAADVTGW